MKDEMEMGRVIGLCVFIAHEGALRFTKWREIGLCCFLPQMDADGELCDLEAVRRV
ncbi:hypothetical protein VDG1235_3291 [Verrucomicrobiia bacterium DG1235]|nr:hypothetical protein VDG1235_3291 [Verrucomicrobiae bacterium DG1235]